MTDPVAIRDAYGRAFLAFHMQFILDFDTFRLKASVADRLEPSDPFQKAPVPEDYDNTIVGFKNCSYPPRHQGCRSSVHDVPG